MCTRLWVVLSIDSWAMTHLLVGVPFERTASNTMPLSRQGTRAMLSAAP
jgi:hypothetical protein